MRIYPVKENHIGSAVSEIPRYKQTDKQVEILLLYYKDRLTPAGKKEHQFNMKPVNNLS